MTRAEAINKVRQMSLPKETMEILEALAPELRESEDERIRKEIISALKFANDGGVYDKHIASLEKQKEQKPKWSEEDEKYLNRVINLWVNDFGEDSDTVKWLKSLRPSWKPSEEHLSALLAVFNDPNNIGSQTCQLALTDLYEQLKKL